ncbi:MAG: chemotaxis protein CheW, partial [Myxococcota bacterium]
LRAVAVEKGHLSEEQAQSMPEHRLSDLVFVPGFSTRRLADQLSGRGVGLDVVAGAVARLGGVISVSSEKGKGTRFSARMTPSASTLPVLGLRCGQHTVSLPLAAVRETLLIEEDDLAPGSEAFWRDQKLPVLHLSDILCRRDAGGTGRLHGVVVGHDDRHALLLAEGLVGREEGTPRSLGPILDALPMYSGGVLQGDGEISLVLDASYLLSVALGLRSAPTGDRNP